MKVLPASVSEILDICSSIPDMQPRFPRTVPRAGTLPTSRPNDISPQHMRMQGLDTLPPQFMNGDIDR